MGINGSIEADAPFNEHFFGLVNFGNTCYVNSVLQALYFCKPFREKIIQYKLGYNQRVAHLSSKDSNNQSNNGTLNSNQNSSNNNTNNDLTDSSSLNTSNSNLNSKDTNKIINQSGVSTNILKQEHLLNCLAELFYTIVTMKKKKGIVQPKKFIARLRKDNDAFDNLFQQDAHEFLNYLLNTCADILKAEMKELYELRKLHELSQKTNEILNNNHNQTSKINTKTHKLLNSSKQQNGASTNQANVNLTNGKKRNTSTNGSTRSISSENSMNSSKIELDDLNRIYLQNRLDEIQSTDGSGGQNREELTWIHELFQGILVNETKCLNCETSSSKEENFFDLSIDVDQNTSLSHCLQEFSNMEMLCGECKYYCETCCSKQEAEKRMRIKKLPRILALHLKRFKFVGVLNKFIKLTYRVVFPFELRLFNTTEDCTNSDRIYDLVSFVVHCGMGLNRGHYISVVKSNGFWFLFDDEQVEKIEVSNFEEFYGLTQDTNKKSETSYILFYETRQS